MKYALKSGSRTQPPSPAEKSSNRTHCQTHAAAQTASAASSKAGLGGAGKIRGGAVVIPGGIAFQFATLGPARIEPASVRSAASSGRSSWVGGARCKAARASSLRPAEA